MKTTGYRGENGSIALVLVLITVALITAIGLEIIFRSQVSATLVTNHRDMEKAFDLARSAFRWSLFRLQLDSTLDKIPVIAGTNYGGQKDDLGEFQWAVPLNYPFALAMPTEASKVNSPIKPEAPIKGESVPEGSFISVLSDESSKLNLNDAGSGGPPGNVAWSGAAEILENLLLEPRFQVYFNPRRGHDHRELLWAIDDWTDGDSEVNHLGGGIEDAEYQREGVKFNVKNGPFYSLDEIRLLKGMSDRLFQDLKPFVTVYPFDAKIPRMSTVPVTEMGRINVNTAPMELIAATFSREAISDQRERMRCAQEVVKYRKNVSFRGIKKGSQEPSFGGFLEQACGLAPQPPIFSNAVEQRVLAVKSDIFSVEATGFVGDVQKTIRAVVNRQDPSKIQILYWKVI